MTNNPASSSHSMSIDCPVCPARGIPPEHLACENCGTDLSPIRRVLELPQHHHNKALQYLEAGAPSKAISELHAALVADPSFANARLLLGKLLWKAGHQSEAIAQWRELIRAHPDDASVNALVIAAERGQARRSRVMRSWPLGVALGVGLTFAAGWLASGWLAADGTRAATPTLVAAPVDLAVPPKHGPAASGPQASAIQASQKGASGSGNQGSSTPVALSSLASRLRDIQQLRVDIDGSVVRVAPNAGLFAVGSAMPDGSGMALLADIRAVIESAEIPLTVVVTGYADARSVKAGGRWKSNKELALFRGFRAISLLDEGGDRHRYFGTSAPGSGVAAFSTDGSDPARQRTVVLEIRVASEAR